MTLSIPYEGICSFPGPVHLKWQRPLYACILRAHGDYEVFDTAAELTVEDEFAGTVDFDDNEGQLGDECKDGFSVHVYIVGIYAHYKLV